MLHKSKSTRYRVGIDEVGRGSIAGPVTVGCVAVPTTYTWRHMRTLAKKKITPPLRDSKQLTPAQRDAWYLWVCAQADIRWAVSSVSAAKVDTLGITRAAHFAADRAHTNMHQHIDSAHVQSVRLDRGLVLTGAEEQEAYTKGDERFVEIALASIMAKVTRDRYMARIAKKYPAYGFAANKGYGSRAHYEALTKHGLIKVHRKTFVDSR